MNDILVSVRGTKEDTGYDVEDGMSVAGESAFEGDMKTFFLDIESVRIDLAEIKQLNQEIMQMHEKGKTIVRTKEINLHKDRIQVKISTVNGLAQKVKAQIEQIDKASELSITRKGCGEGSAAERTRTAITAALKKRLKEHMAEFTELRNRIQEDYKETVERKIFAVTGQKLSDEEIEKIASGNGEDVFMQQAMEQGRGRILDTVAEIQERSAGVKDIEQSLLELHQIFVDMATLVEAQGEVLDNIEKQVGRSVEFVTEGVANLQDAKEMQKSGRLILCIALAAGIVVIIIIVIIVIMMVM